MRDRIWADKEYQRAMSPVGLYTYEWVARGLPSSVRQAIEDSMDCLGGQEHAWDVDRSSPPLLQPAETYQCMECTRCGIVRPNPRYVRPDRKIRKPKPPPASVAAYCECRACLY